MLKNGGNVNSETKRCLNCNREVGPGKGNKKFCKECISTLTPHQRSLITTPNLNKDSYKRAKKLHPNLHKDKYKRAKKLHPNLGKDKYKRAKKLHPNLGKDRYKRAKELHANLYKDQYKRTKELDSDFCKKMYARVKKLHPNLNKDKYRYAKRTVLKRVENLRNRLRSLRGDLIKDFWELLGLKNSKALNDYLLSIFKAGMTFKNNGIGSTHDVWQLDHKIPFTAININNDEEFAKVFHYSNIRCLWGDEHAAKTKAEHKKGGLDG